jgi:hypothetical protein
MSNTGTAPTQAQVDKYRYLTGMLDSALHEMREFSKRKPDALVTEPKIKLLNRLLLEIKTVVEREASNSYLDLLSEQELPQNSDAVLILGQYQSALKSFHARHYRFAADATRWVTQEWLLENGLDDEDDASDEENDDVDVDED